MVDVRLAQVSLFENEEAELSRVLLEDRTKEFEVLRFISEYLAYEPKAEKKIEPKKWVAKSRRHYEPAIAKRMNISMNMKSFN